MSFYYLLHQKVKLSKCEFINSSEFSACTGSDKDIAFYASGNDLSSNLLNAKVSLHPTSPGGGSYSKALCCSSDFAGVNINFHNRNTCQDGEFEFAFLQSEYNSKLKLESDSNYNITICLESDEQFADLDIKIDNVNSGYDTVGYDCMYRFGSGYTSIGGLEHNGKVSSCGAEYLDLATYNKYPFAVFARLVQNINTLVCNNDCTSTLDNRIYSDCADKVQTCSNIPLVCDGSLDGAWVKYDDEREVRCQKPFDQFRKLQVSDQELNIDAEQNECEDVVVKKYNVLLNQESVTMNVYVCLDEDK